MSSAGEYAGGNRLAACLLWLAIVAAYLYPLFLFPIHNPNERARIYMTVAMWDDDTFAIGYRNPRKSGRGFKDSGLAYDRWGYVNDKALVCDDPDLKPPDCQGTLYSAKAPGTSYLGYPFYGLLKTVADVMEKELTMEAIILYLRLFVVVLPSLFMLALFRRFAWRSDVDGPLADLCTMGMALGSMVYTYAHMFAGHQVAAYLLFFGFYTAWRSRDRDDWWWPVLTGLASCMAVCVEYPMVLVTLVVFGYQMWVKRSFKTFLLYCGGAVLPALLTAWFHQAAFGSPLSTPYTTLENPQFVKDIAPGFMGLRAPTLENLWGTFLSPYMGMFFFSPWMILVVPGMLLYAAWYAWRDNGKKHRVAVAAGSGGVLALTLFISCHSLWRSGWTLGPRYIVPFVPFAGVVILLAFGQVAAKRPLLARLLVAPLVLVSVVVTGLSSVISQGFHTAFFNPLTELVLPVLARGYVTFNLGNLVGLHGIWSLVPLLAAVIPGLLYLVWQSTSRAGIGWACRLFLASLILLVGAASFKGLTLPAKELNLRKAKAQAWTRNHFLPLDYLNDDLAAISLRKEAATLFPRQQSVQALRMADALVAGDCKETASVFKRFKTGEEDSLRHQAFGLALQLVSPMPSAVVVPLSLRPDFHVPAWQVDRLEKKYQSD